MKTMALSENSQRTYHYAYQEFLRWYQNDTNTATRADIDAWKKHLHEQGKRNGTIKSKAAAVAYALHHPEEILPARPDPPASEWPCPNCGKTRPADQFWTWRKNCYTQTCRFCNMMAEAPPAPVVKEYIFEDRRFLVRRSKIRPVMMGRPSFKSSFTVVPARARPRNKPEDTWYMVI